MECFYCRSYNRKFYCSQCLSEKLADHEDELATITAERQQAIQQAEHFLDRASKLHSLNVEKKQRSNNIGKLLGDQQRITKETSLVSQKIEDMKSDMNRRRKILEQSKRRLEETKVSYQRDMETNQSDSEGTNKSVGIEKAWHRTFKMTARTRQILVKEVASLFDLKPGVVEDADDDVTPNLSTRMTNATTTATALIMQPSISTSSSSDQQQQQHRHHQHQQHRQQHDKQDTESIDRATLLKSQRLRRQSSALSNSNLQRSVMPFSRSAKAHDQQRSFEDLYICGVTLPARLIDVSKYPKEELNSALGYTTQMLDLIVRYLGVKLPFTLFRKDIHTYIRSIPHSRLYPNQSKMPLFLEDDKNFRKFLIGVSMLNYDIAYLCYTQGVLVPLSQVGNTSQNLMACCNAPSLGLRSHAMIYQGITDLDFSYDFQQVLRQTSLRYRCGSRIATRGHHPMEGNMNQERREKYFKVRRSAFLGDRYEDDDDDDEDEEDEEGDDGDNDAYDIHEEEDENDDEDDTDAKSYPYHHHHHRSHHSGWSGRQHRNRSLREQGLEDEDNGDNDDDDDDDDGDIDNHDQQDESTGSSNENWNLVDVMPAFAAPSGQHESIFHLGATIMPGVLGMMENLSARHNNGIIGSSSPSTGGGHDDSMRNYRVPDALRRRW